jgi:hypothetical protein
MNAERHGYTCAISTSSLPSASTASPEDIRARRRHADLVVYVTYSERRPVQFPFLSQAPTARPIPLLTQRLLGSFR